MIAQFHLRALIPSWFRQPIHWASDDAENERHRALKGERGWWRSCMPCNEGETTTTTEEVKKRVH